MSKEYTRSLTILGSIPIAGSVLFHDDFESLLNWTQAQGAGDSIFELDPSLAFNGKQSLRMKTRTTDSAEGDPISAIHYFRLGPTKTISATVIFNIASNTPIEQFVLSLIFYDGTNKHWGAVYYRPGVPDFAYRIDATTYSTITGSETLLLCPGWHSLTLNIDFNALLYHSMIIDHLPFDLSSVTIFSDTNPTDSHLFTSIGIETDSANPAEINIDDVIYTEGIPI